MCQKKLQSSNFLKVACMLRLSWILVKNNGGTNQWRWTTEPQLHHECEHDTVSGCMCSHSDSPLTAADWYPNTNTPLRNAWLIFIHGFAFVFQLSNKSSAPGWSSLEGSAHWGTDVNLTGLHQEPALKMVLLECFQDKWWWMAACPFWL